MPSRLGRARTLGDCQDQPIVRTGALLHARRPVARASFDHSHEPVDHVALRREVRPLLRVHAGRVRRLVHLQAEDGACGGGEEQGQRPHVRTRLRSSRATVSKVVARREVKQLLLGFSEQQLSEGGVNGT